MSHYGTLRDYRFPETADDIRGSALYGIEDKKLGKIDDVIFDHTSGTVAYLVVDTGGWLSTKKFVVPANGVHYSVKDNDDGFHINLTKEQIENLPPYDEKDVDSDERWADYENRYRAKWETSPVMHRAETDRNITPTTYQMEGNKSSLAASGEPVTGATEADLDAVEAAADTADNIEPPGTDTVVIDNTATGIGGRWDTFQERLRERRKQAAVGCNRCSMPSSSAGERRESDIKAG